MLTSRFAHNLPDRWVEGNEYEGRLFGGAYSPFELKNSAPDSAKRKMIPLARERYNAIREEFGLPLVTDWSQRPVDLMHRVPAPLMSGTKCDDAPDALAQASAAIAKATGGAIVSTNHYIRLSAKIDAVELKLERSAELAKLVEELLRAGNANTRDLKSLAEKISPGWCKKARAILRELGEAE